MIEKPSGNEMEAPKYHFCMIHASVVPISSFWDNSENIHNQSEILILFTYSTWISCIALPIFLSVAYLSMQFSAINQASGSDVQNLGYGKGS